MNIAIISPGDRTDKITVPLDAYHIEYSVNPNTLSGFDLTICDTPDRQMLKYVVESKIRRIPVLYRMRGDPFWGIDEWVDSRVKKTILFHMLNIVDGCVAITPDQADTFRNETNISTHLAHLPKKTDNWKSVSHNSKKLRILTLTNAVYWQKIKPLTDIMKSVNSTLQVTGGYWKIGSWSKGYHNRLIKSCKDLKHVEFHLKLNAKKELAQSNCMIHYSNFDVFPNAILEGMASNIPVITNDHTPFEETNAPHIICNTQMELKANLLSLVNPDTREKYGNKGLNYIEKNHNPKYIGSQYYKIFKQYIQ